MMCGCVDEYIYKHDYIICIDSAVVKVSFSLKFCFSPYAVPVCVTRLCICSPSNSNYFLPDVGLSARDHVTLLHCV